MSKYQIVRTVLKSNRNIVERGILDTTENHIYDRSQCWPGSGILIKGGRVNIDFRAQIYFSVWNHAIMKVICTCE
jgi:dUTPase